FSRAPGAHSTFDPIERAPLVFCWLYRRDARTDRSVNRALNPPNITEQTMTDTSFTLKQNAKQAASRMIAKGSAPSLEFEIVPQGDLFAIQWGAPIPKAP